MVFYRCIVIDIVKGDHDFIVLKVDRGKFVLRSACAGSSHSYHSDLMHRFARDIVLRLLGIIDLRNKGFVLMSVQQ